MGILRAAWVPDDDPEREWQVAADLAVSWVEQEARAQDAAAVLVLNAFGAEQHVPVLRSFAQRHSVTTPRAGRDRVGSGIGPVLAYVPDARTLDFATGLARNSSLAVVESVGLLPLGGWAAHLTALDLTRPGGESPALDDRLAEALDRLKFYGNNAYGPSFDRQQATRVLSDLHSAGLLDREVVISARAARGVSPAGLDRLRQLISGVKIR
ncbi:hypothetical protein AB0H77_06035 [Streptomyces sp. NPDC050844]|uniref:hypothetical protein n=1 Tax=Streptomyces sp. NPDC050844 TaxID=3155790 RepID=UPI0033DA1962